MAKKIQTRKPIPIDSSLGLHEIIASVRQLSYMKQHSQTLLDTLNPKLEITYAKAPIGRKKKSQTYELHRPEKPDPAVRERLLEKIIWKQWCFDAFTQNEKPYFSPVCQFIQSYQVPLQGTRDDRKWGKLDLVGVTPDALPVVIELKQERADDTPLRLLAEAVAYACAIRRAWNEGWFKREWESAMKKNRLSRTFSSVLCEIPVILVAPSDFWRVKIGTPGKRTGGKVRDDAWLPFMNLIGQCAVHGFPITILQFDLLEDSKDGSGSVSDMREVALPLASGSR